MKKSNILKLLLLAAVLVAMVGIAPSGALVQAQDDG
jgi:hypothetical protein